MGQTIASLILTAAIPYTRFGADSFAGRQPARVVRRVRAGKIFSIAKVSDILPRVTRATPTAGATLLRYTVLAPRHS
jgi:hypothetical protein